MVKSYAQTYRENLDSIRNKVFQLRMKFDRLKGELLYDYKTGIISEDIYEKLRELGMDSIAPTGYEKYFLTREEVEFVKEYGEFENHELMIRVLKPRYDEKASILEEICYSAIKGTEILEMDLNTLRIYFMELVTNRAKEYIKENETWLNDTKRKFGDKACLRSDYMETLRNVERAKEIGRISLDKVNSYTKEELIDQLFAFLEINRNYLTWYQEKKARKELHEGTTFTELVSELSKEDESIQSLKESIDEDKTDTLFNFQADYIEFLNNTYKNYLPFKEYMVTKGAFKRESKYQKEVYDSLKEVFDILVKNNIIKRYIKELLNIERITEETFTLFMDLVDPDRVEFKSVIDFIDYIYESSNQNAKLYLEGLTLTYKGYVKSLESSSKSISRISTKTTDLARYNELYVLTSRHNSNSILPPSIHNDEEILIFESIEQVLEYNKTAGKKLTYK